MSHNQITLRLLDEEHTSKEIKTNDTVEKYDSEHLPEGMTIYYKKEDKTDYPKWFSFFSEHNETDKENELLNAIQKEFNVKNTNLKFVLTVTVKDTNNTDRKFCLFFGRHAKSLLEKDIYEDDFSLQLAFRLLDPKEISAVKYLNISKINIKNSRASTKKTKAGNLISDDLNIFLEEISGQINKIPKIELKKITGKISEDFSATGKFCILTIKNLCTKLLEVYQQKEISTDFSIFNQIRLVKDNKTVEKCNSELIKHLKEKENQFSKIDIAIRDIEHLYKENVPTETNEQNPDFAEEVLKKLRVLKKFSIEALQKKSIKLSDQSKINLYESLSYQCTVNSNEYILIYGKWYHVDQKYFKNINNKIEALTKSKLKFPSYTGQTEKEFNESCLNDNFELLDRKNIVLQDGEKIGELCDLYKDNHFIHVKRYSSSASLSHLFTQVVTYSEVLLDSNKRQDILNIITKKLNQASESVEDVKETTRISASAAVNSSSRQIQLFPVNKTTSSQSSPILSTLQTSLKNFDAKKNIIVLVFLDDKKSHNSIIDFKLLAKVSLLHCVKSVQDMGYQVQYAWLKKQSA